MADKNGQEPTEGQGQAPTTPPATPDASVDNFSREYVEKIRREAAANRTKANDLETQLKKFQEADMGDREKLQARLDESTKALDASNDSLRRSRGRNAVIKASTKVNIDPSLAEKLVELEFDDDGKPVGVDEAVAALAKQYPHLVAPAGGDSSPTNPPRSKKPTLTREDVKKMSTSEINDRWEEVQKVLSGK